MIDPKDLIPLTGDFKIGGIFYLQEGKEFLTCCIHPEELKDEKRKLELSERTKKYQGKGRLFLNRNKPWHAMNGY